MISIVGAGPVGNFAGYLLAKKGYKVEIFEKNKEIGKPVQCTGIVTNTISKLIDVPDECVANRINDVEIFAPNGKSLKIRFREANLILDRERFDKFLSKKAEKEGVKIFLDHKIEDFKDDILSIRKLDRNEIIEEKIERKSDNIIGADGPQSIIAKSLGNKKREYWTSLQYRIEHKNENKIEFYPYLGTFAWIVPENKEIARVGIIGSLGIRKILDDFLERKIGKDFRSKIIETQGGLIPKFDKKLKVSDDNTYIIGDAAGMVKATTAGGIIQGMRSAEILAECIGTEKKFSRELRKRLFFDLSLHKYMRKIMDKFDEDDWNKLIGYFDKPKMKRILETIDRDEPSKMVFKLLLKEPRLISFVKFII
ncbi:MAG: geranylgeranyl reductase family protein [Candidatus Woesearchaeota archaeon]